MSVTPFPVRAEHPEPDVLDADALDVRRQIAQIETDTGRRVAIIEDLGSRAYVSCFDPSDRGCAAEVMWMWIVSRRLRNLPRH